MTHDPAAFDVAVPDIPLPEENTGPAEIADTFGLAGFKLGFIGAGQGGGRLAEAFHRLGYRRVCAVNTAAPDLATLALPDAQKLCLGAGGAGKDPAVAKAVLAEHREDILDLAKRAFGPSLDRVMVCASAGGGTGSGMVSGLVDLGVELHAALRLPATKVGVILALPKISEGARVHANAQAVLRELKAKVEAGVVSPLILLDNERIGSLYPSLAVDPFWAVANASIATLFHLFNTVCVKDSTYTAFDRRDFQTVLDSGLITFGAVPVTKWADATDLSHAVRHTLTRNILTGDLHLASGTVGAAIVIGGKEILATLPQLHLDHAFEQLTRLLRPGSTVHRGIYRGDKPSLVIYTALGGLAVPEARTLSRSHAISGV